MGSDADAVRSNSVLPMILIALCIGLSAEHRRERIFIQGSHTSYKSRSLVTFMVAASAKKRFWSQFMDRRWWRGCSTCTGM